MDFTFTEEQQICRTPRAAWSPGITPSKPAASAWRRPVKAVPTAGLAGLADLGVLALNVPEEDGGLGGNAIDTLLVMGALGEGLVLEPFLSSAVLSTRAWQMGRPRKRKACCRRWPPARLSSCSRTMKRPAASTGGRSRPRAREDDGSYVLNGRKSMIAMRRMPMCCW